MGYLEKEAVISMDASCSLMKTGSFKERSPDSEKWIFFRGAAILRRIAVEGGMGVGKLSKVFGGKNNRKLSKPHKVKSSRGHLRKLVQQLGKAGLLSEEKGELRKITQKGKELLDSIAKSVENSRVIPLWNEESN